MFSFKYRPSKHSGMYKATFSDWKFSRMGSKNAAYGVSRFVRSGTERVYYVLYSYATPICVVKAVYSENRFSHLYIHLHEDAYKFSATTNRHLSLFLRTVTNTLQVGHGLTYYTLKDIACGKRIASSFSWIEYHGSRYMNLDVPVTMRLEDMVEMEFHVAQGRFLRPYVECVPC